MGSSTATTDLEFLLVLLVFFQLSFFLESVLGLFLILLFALIFATLITHVFLSLLDNDWRRSVAQNLFSVEKG